MRGSPIRIVLALMCTVFATTIEAGAQNLIQCGGSARGLSSTVSAGLDAAVRASGSGLTITHQTSSGGYANIAQVLQGNCQLGSAIMGQAKKALDGKEPFKKPVAGFSAVMVVMNRVPMQWVMSKAFADKYGISSLKDIAARKPPLRVILNRRGILPSEVAEQSLKEVGISLSDIESWGGKVEFLASRNAGSLMQDGRADMWVNSTFIGSSAIRKISNAMEVKLLTIPGDVRQKIMDIYGEKPFTIPADSYPWLSQDVESHSPEGMIIVKDTMDEDTVYNLTKGVLENLDKVQAVHPAMRALSPQDLLSLKGLAYHPGAVRAYKEAGLM